METLGATVGLRKLRETNNVCHILGHPVTEFLGRLDGQEVRIGGDLLLNIPVAYTAHLCVAGRPTRTRKRLTSKLLAKLKAAGFHAVEWPNEPSGT